MSKLGPKLVLNLDIHRAMAPEAHGYSHKDQVVLHETVSYDIAGLGDIVTNESVLVREGYGIHGLTDQEGHVAWALGLGNAVFYHCAGGSANLRAIGIEQISPIPIDVEKAGFTKAALTAAKTRWSKRQKQLDATAKLLAAIHRAHPHIPLKTSNGKTPGITTHYLVTHAYGIVGGHWDCWPVNEGGYYPLSEVIADAKSYARKGY